MKKLIAVVFGLFWSAAVLASPVIIASPAGSTIFFFASNVENRDYICTINYSITWSDFGTQRSETSTGTATVRAKQQRAEVMKIDTSYSNLRLTSFNFNCA